MSKHERNGGVNGNGKSLDTNAAKKFIDLFGVECGTLGSFGHGRFRILFAIVLKVLHTRASRAKETADASKGLADQYPYTDLETLRLSRKDVKKMQDDFATLATRQKEAEGSKMAWEEARNLAIPVLSSSPKFNKLSDMKPENFVALVQAPTSIELASKAPAASCLCEDPQELVGSGVSGDEVAPERADPHDVVWHDAT